MKIKNVNLEYWVFYLDMNSHQPKRINILEGMEQDIAKHIRSSKNSWRHIKDRLTLKDYLKNEFMYHYWSKSEMEYLVHGFFKKDCEKATKLDVWYQIELNLDMITNYVIDKMQIKFKEGE